MRSSGSSVSRGSVASGVCVAASIGATAPTDSFPFPVAPPVFCFLFARVNGVEERSRVT